MNKWLKNTPEGQKVKQKRMVYQTDDFKIKFMYFNLRGVVNHKDIYDLKKPEYDKWVAFAEEQKEKAPKGMKSLIQSSKSSQDMKREIAFVTSAI